MHEFFAYCKDDVAAHRDRLGVELVRNVDAGSRLTAQQIAWAQGTRTELYRRTARLLQCYDLLALPATPVAAPALDVQWVSKIGDVELSRYFEWQRCASRITVTAHPALSLPSGFTPSGLPVGLQLVGRHRDELNLMRHAAAYERASGWHARTPSVTRASR
jgi:amidase